MPRSFEAIFGFAAPSPREREALRLVRTYLGRAGSALGSRDALGGIEPGRGPLARTGDPPAPPALQTAVRESVEAAAAFCAGLLEAADPEAAADRRRPPGG